ncbi:MAG: LbtU family siderophore porin [Desulfatibacillaceae bacterium]
MRVRSMVVAAVLLVLMLSAPAYAGEDGATVGSLAQALEISGALEVEVGFADDFAGEDASDGTLSTVEFGVDVTACDWATGSVVFLWEEDDTEQVELDEGSITLGNLERFPLYLQAGKYVVPFGRYETLVISDPLTLELGETRESALGVGFEAHGAYGMVYGFNGDVDQIGDNDQINGYGASVGFVVERDTMALDVGAGVLSNILESDTYGDWFLGEHEDPAGNPAYLGVDEFVAGYALHAVAGVGPVTLIGEYVSAAEDPEFHLFDATTDALVRVYEVDRPSAWSVEAGVTFPVMGRKATVALAWQGTDNSVMLELPETRLLGSIGVAINDYVAVAVEYSHDEDYAAGEGGTGENADAGTLQLALSF